jgi:hypothetical protein
LPSQFLSFRKSLGLTDTYFVDIFFFYFTRFGSRPLNQAAAQASAPRHSPSGVGSPGPVEIIPADPNANADGVVVRPWSQGSDFSRTRRRQLGKKMAELRPYNLVWGSPGRFFLPVLVLRLSSPVSDPASWRGIPGRGF